VRITQIELPQGQSTPLRNGDVLRAFNSTSVALPIQRQNKRVRVEGEVARPGEFVLPPQSTVSDALRAAGGVTPAAYVFGTEFSRESVRVTQQDNYERALRDFYRRALVVVFALVGGMLFLLGFFYTLSALDLTSAVRQPLIWLGIVVFGVIQIGSLIYYNRFTCPRCQKLFRPLNTGHGQPRCVGCRLSILEIKQFAREATPAPDLNSGPGVR